MRLEMLNFNVSFIPFRKNLVQKRMKIPNFAARTAAYKFCSAKQAWLESGVSISFYRGFGMSSITKSFYHLNSIYSRVIAA